MPGGRLLAILAVLCAASVVVPASADARAFGSRVLKVGSRGNDVRVLQTTLTRIGFRTAVDGVFGQGTRVTVRRWETAVERRADGRVTRRDARVLHRAVRRLEDPQAAARRTPATADPERTGGASAGDGPATPVERATLNPDGTVTPPASAPERVKQVILAANEIAHKPYKYGGGHGSWKDSGYDCSGSVSYALHGGGLLDRPMPSSGFESYGDPGPGMWITTYANGGHMYMVVAGLRFDTSAAKTGGSRWTDEMRSAQGFVVRHPPGF